MWGDGGAYGTWAAYLDEWQKDLLPHERELPRLAEGDFTTDTWTRLVTRIFDALGARLGLWSDALSRAMSHTSTEFGVGQALTQARVGLVTILSLADHPSLPEDLRARLREPVERQVRSAQAQLEQQIERMRQGGSPRAMVDARMRTVRENPLDAVLSPTWAASNPTPNSSPVWQTDPTVRPKRTFALD